MYSWYSKINYTVLLILAVETYTEIIHVISLQARLLGERPTGRLIPNLVSCVTELLNKQKADSGSSGLNSSNMSWIIESKKYRTTSIFVHTSHTLVTIWIHNLLKGEPQAFSESPVSVFPAWRWRHHASAAVFGPHVHPGWRKLWTTWCTGIIRIAGHQYSVSTNCPNHCFSTVLHILVVSKGKLIVVLILYLQDMTTSYRRLRGCARREPGVAALQ